MEELNILDIDESDITVLLTHLFNGSAGDKYRAAVKIYVMKDFSFTVFCNESLEYLLPDHTSWHDITKVKDDISDLCPMLNGYETSFSAWLNKEGYSCQIFHNEDEV